MKNFVIAVLGKRGKKPSTSVEVTDMQSSALTTLVEVDAYRQRLAAGDPVPNQALGGIELTLAHELGRHVRQR